MLSLVQLGQHAFIPVSWGQGGTSILAREVGFIFAGTVQMMVQERGAQLLRQRNQFGEVGQRVV
jgi:hypothetical protein